MTDADSAPFISDPAGSFAEADRADPTSSVGEYVSPFETTQQLMRSIGGGTARFGQIGDLGEQLSQPEPYVAPDALNKKYGIPGKLSFDSALPDSVGQSMYEAKIDEIKRASVRDRAPAGILPTSARYGAQFMADLLDPVNLAAVMVPSVPELELGASVGARLASRGIAGAASGAVGMAPLAGLKYAMGRQEQSDYDAYSAVSDIAVGAGMGAVLHVGGGLLSDYLTNRVARSKAGRIIEDSPQDRSALLNTAVSQLASDNPVEVRPILPADAAREMEPGGWGAFPESIREQPLANISPPELGMVRFYHGGSPEGSGLPTTGGSRWVTPEFAYARDYRRAGDRPGAVWYVDLPENHPVVKSVQGISEEDVASGVRMRQFYGNVEVPEDLASGFRPANEAALDAERGITAAVTPEAPAHITEPPPPLGESATSTPRAKPYETVPKEPVRLNSFLARGIKINEGTAQERIAKFGLEDPGGDISAIIGGARGRPGLINNVSGERLDDAGLRAYEAGYFPQGRPDINQLLDAIDKDHNGQPVYSDHDLDAAQAFRDARAGNAEIDALSDQLGIPNKNITREQFFDQVKQHLSEDDFDARTGAYEDTHVEDYRQAEEMADTWFREGHGEDPRDGFDAEQFYGKDQGRTLEDLEHEHQQEAASVAAQQRGGGDEPGRSTAAHTPSLPEGAGFGGRGAGPPGREGAGTSEAAGRGPVPADRGATAAADHASATDSAIRAASGERPPGPTDLAADAAVKETAEARMKVAVQQIEDHEEFFRRAEAAGALTDEVRAELEAINNLDKEAKDYGEGAAQAAACVARGLAGGNI